ncbi:hypothetical protein BH10ACT1_BH10ACT1_08140 [soil metagenome]
MPPHTDHTRTTSTSAASARLREIASADPDRPAIEHGDLVVTYRELDAEVDATVARLAADLGPGRHHVGLRMTSSRALTTASTALARAGHVSVPVDPTAPEERVAVIAHDARLAIILTDVPGDDALDLGVRTAPEATYRLEPTGPSVDVEVAATELVGISFTSGSTGVPKGIAVGPGHRDLQGAWLKSVFPDDVRVGVLEFGTVGFFEHLLQGVLLLGGTMVPYAIRDLGLAPMAAWLVDERIQGMATVPTILRFLVPSLEPQQFFPDLEFLALAGEASTWEDVASIRPHLPPNALLLNSYGTTETGPISAFVVPPDATGTGALPAGMPMPGVEVEVLDENGDATGPGEVGELVITSLAVGLGYWRRPDLDATTYEDLPDGRRRCRSGDAGRVHPDGAIEVRGRLDHVAKVSGNRVDLGDVEAGLARDPAIASAAVTTETDDAGNTRLVAYLVAAPAARPTSREVRAELARRLPGHMLPGRTVFVPSLPQLANGKVDRNALPHLAPLPEPGRIDPAALATDPLTTRVAQLWRKVLETDDIGPDDDFFDIGGDSMRAAQLFAEIERDLGISRRISLLLEAPTLSALVAALDKPQHELPVLLSLRTEGSLPPLFVIHGGMGDIMFARQLADLLDADQPVYALQPPPLVAGRPAEPSIEDLAARYVEAMEALVGNGPARIFGFSFGGTVAFEMALQRQAGGAHDDWLGIGDTLAPSIERRSVEDHVATRRATRGVGGAARRARHRAKALIDLGPRQGAREGLGVARRAAERTYDRLATPWWARQELARGDALMAAYGVLALHHHPTDRFRGDALVVATRQSLDHGLPLDLGWSDHLGDRTEHLTVDGRHRDLVKQPAVSILASAIGSAI